MENEFTDYIIAGFAGGDSFEGTSAPAKFMFMPGGTHSITGDRSGTPTQMHVKVDRSTADVMNAVLRAHQAKGNKPYFDFNHAEADAAAWPEQFTWEETPKPGVYVTCAWSKPGSESVTGKSWRSFSPAFAPDKWVSSPDSPARIVGAPLVMGGLVNDPAFKKIQPLWARNRTPDNNMQKTDAEKIIDLQKEIDTLKAAAATETNADVIKAKDAEIAEAKKDLEEAQATIKARNEERADVVIKAAQARGALPSQPKKDSDEEKLVCRYRDLVIADPANSVLVNTLPAAVPGGAGFLTAARGRAEVSKPSLHNVFKAYIQARESDMEIYPCITAKNRMQDRLAAPALYKKELRDLFDKPESALEIMRAADTYANFDETPIPTTMGGFMKAANALGTLSGILVVQRSLDLLKYDFPELSRVTTDFSAEPVQYNQPVTTRLRAVPAVTSYDPVAGYADSNVTDTDVSITINNHRAVQVYYTANDLASTKRLLFPEQEEGMHFALGADLVTNLLGLVTPANFIGQVADGSQGLPTSITVPGKTVASLDQMARPTVIALKAALNQRGAMGGTRTLLLNELYHAALEGDTTIVGNLINVDSGRAIATGRLPVIAGFQPYEAPYLPTANNLVGFGFRADALALAARLPNDYSKVFPGVTGGGVVQIVTNPDTGLSVMLVMFLDHKLGQTRMRVAWMTGYAVGNQLAGQLLTSQ